MAGSSLYTVLHGEGTSQAQRSSPALDPAYMPIDERDMADWIRFARSYAKQLTFFDNDNVAAGTWEAFLDDGTGSEEFIADLISYVGDAGSFANDPQKAHSFSRPHLALFISFLQLLGYVKDQLNGFTRKHLDFYYHTLLGLDKKKAMPDVTNVVIELTDDVKALLLPRGTGLFAGKDSLGKDLLYKTEKDTVVNRATVQAVKTLYTGRNIFTIRQVRENSPKPDKGLLEIWQLALGDPKKGYKLPPYRNLSEAAYDVLSGVLYTDFKSKDSEALQYVNGQLLLFPEEFENLIQAAQTGTDAKWQIIEYVLKKAYRRKMLKQIREKEQDPDAGFLNMFAFALGETGSGSPLPAYKGNAADLTLLGKDLQSNGAEYDTAKKYVRESLFLTEDSFRHAMATRSNAKAGSAEWIVVYADVENAWLKMRGNQVPEPVREVWENPVATNDARAKAASSATGRQFNTFGKPQAPGTPDEQPADIGFAISSPVLMLQEGERTITLILSFREDEPVSGLGGKFQPFSYFLSSSKGWLSLGAGPALNTGNYITGSSEEGYTTAVLDPQTNVVTVTGGMDFSGPDLGKYIVLTRDNSLYKISKVISARSIAVTPAGEQKEGSSPAPAMQKYDPAYVHTNAMRVSFTLYETDPPVVAPVASDSFSTIQSDYPVLKILLKQPAGNGEAIVAYPLVKDFRLQRATIQVEVKNIRSLVLQNDDAVINYKKPFELFGYKPEAGSRLYFAHPELCGKQLEMINLQFEWMNAPADFEAYYADYFKIKNNDKDAKSELKGFTGTLELVDHDTVVEKKNIVLLPVKQDASVKEGKNYTSLKISLESGRNKPLSATHPADDGGTPDEEAVNWKRHFAIMLTTQDFQHDAYPVLLTKQMFIKADKSADDELKKLPPLNPPYTPKLASFIAGYRTSSEIGIGNGETEQGGSLYHITAFGYKKLDTAAKTGQVYFLPYFENAGELYIGTADLLVPQNLSLLFKMSEGSADPNLANASVSWHYLSNNEWKELKGPDIVSDTTNGLLNTGIIEFAVPHDAVPGDTLFRENLYWLRASVTGNADAIPDTVDIFAQGISAVFDDHGNADDHYRHPLPPGSIQEPVVQIPEVKKIAQPFSSSKGKPAEADGQFYIRVSERLRHKGRALTMWDYERLILERFPDIYKVKCVPAGIPGGVDIIVIPNIKGMFPFNPFEPKVPADGIGSIKKFIEQRMPSWAMVTVRNASYVQVKTRFSVRIKEGYGESFYIAKLQDELIRYLAPWAYDEGADIFLNRRIDADMIVNFAAERPYVDYVAGIKLFRMNGNGVPEAVSDDNGENFIRAERSNEVLVSATSHQIDPIPEEFYENTFTGIGYMRIELDFRVG